MIAKYMGSINFKPKIEHMIEEKYVYLLWHEIEYLKTHYQKIWKVWLPYMQYQRMLKQPHNCTHLTR